MPTHTHTHTHAHTKSQADNIYIKRSYQHKYQESNSFSTWIYLSYIPTPLFPLFRPLIKPPSRAWSMDRDEPDTLAGVRNLVLPRLQCPLAPLVVILHCLITRWKNDGRFRHELCDLQLYSCVGHCITRGDGKETQKLLGVSESPINKNKIFLFWVRVQKESSKLWVTGKLHNVHNVSPDSMKTYG